MRHRRSRALAVLAALPGLFGARLTLAEGASDSLPGSPRPVGPSLAQEAPPTPPAPGGRAPSFGAPTDQEEWSFRLGGRLSGWQSFGIGQRPANPPEPYNGTPLHIPALTAGRGPFFAGAGGTLILQYGNSLVQANLTFEGRFTGVERTGYHRAESGPAFRTGFLTVTPPPLGPLVLRFQVGAFSANYGAPGPWGWGLFGPLLAIHGYGETSMAEFEATPDLRLLFEHGIMGMPEVTEGFVRSTYSGWAEEGISTLVQHAHTGFVYKNEYTVKLHWAMAMGYNHRRFLADIPESRDPARPRRDGRIHVGVLETRWQADPYGQLGVSGAYWNFLHAFQVHDGIWWGLDWTAGGREMSHKFLGSNSSGTGEIAAVSAEYDFSVARMLYHPEAFSGNAPDLRVALAAIHHFTLATRDPEYEGATGYMLAADLEYVATRWLSVLLRAYGESRDVAVYERIGYIPPLEPLPDEGAGGLSVFDSERARWTAFNLTPGLAFHYDWQSQDRIELGYSRYFYSDAADNNPEKPLDRHVVTLGARLTF